jgi:hypothetical protein
MSVSPTPTEIAARVHDMRLDILFGSDTTADELLGDEGALHFLQGLAHLENAYRSFQLAALHATTGEAV